MIRVTLFVLLFLPLVAVAHFIVFPRETRCILIDFSGFKKQQNLYYRQQVPAVIVSQLLQREGDAERLVAAFWNDGQHINYKLIYCSSQQDYNDYGRAGAPAVTNIKLGAFVVIPAGIPDVNVLCHEISHTVLFRKIGWYNLHFKIPTWFDEGLAMQVDHREYYSIDSLLTRKKDGIILPDVTKMYTPGQFHNGSITQVLLNYSTAKYLVHEWLKSHSLNKFVESIKMGYSFETSYNTK